MNPLILGGREHLITEPVFKKLRKIITAFNSLTTTSSEAEKINNLTIMLDNLTDNSLKLTHLKNGELEELLKAIPAICHLKATSENINDSSSSDSWGDIYAHLSACLGWTYDYIDNNMTLSRLEEYQAYWQKHPPTHQLVAAYLGYEHQANNASQSFLSSIAAQVKSAQK